MEHEDLDAIVDMLILCQSVSDMEMIRALKTTFGLDNLSAVAIVSTARLIFARGNFTWGRQVVANILDEAKAEINY